jgi:hypothetical protein
MSVWLSDSGMLCEVEFPGGAASAPVRALLRADQLRDTTTWGHQ